MLKYNYGSYGVITSVSNGVDTIAVGDTVDFYRDTFGKDNLIVSGNVSKIEFPQLAQKDSVAIIRLSHGGKMFARYFESNKDASGKLVVPVKRNFEVELI